METNKLDGGIKWDDCYLLGDEQVDAQHKELFNLVNSLVRSCEDGTSIEHLIDTLSFLIDYTVKHFNDEEALQIKYNYPEYAKHKKLHEDFKLTVGDLVQQFSETGISHHLCDDVNKVIVKWLVNHILSEDKKIGEHLKHCRAK